MSGRRSDQKALRALLASTPAGVCPICTKPVEPKKTRGMARLICGARECRLAYLRAYDVDRRAARRLAELEVRSENFDFVSEPWAFVPDIGLPRHQERVEYVTNANPPSDLA